MLQMKLFGDSVLREQCSPVADITPEIYSVLAEMVNVMKQHNGVGLAAPQVGITQRFLVMKNPKNGMIYKMVNPKIVSASNKKHIGLEGCLSLNVSENIPLSGFVSRPKYVTVEWTDENGNHKTQEMSGALAQIVQHEIDHLDGILFIDYKSPAFIKFVNGLAKLKSKIRQTKLKGLQNYVTNETVR